MHLFSKIFSKPVIFTTLLAAVFSTAQADFIYAPGNAETTEGGGNNTTPFSAGSSFYPSQTVRFQQVYNSSLFGAGTPVLISAVSFRHDTANSPSALNAVISQLKLSFGVSSIYSEDNLSLTFADNLGANPAVVYDSSYTYNYAGSFAQPRPWSLKFNFTAPFFYNPASGNLILDVQTLGVSSGNIPTFDAASVGGDGISRVRALDVNALTGVATSIGLVTQFEVTPIPEPGVSALLALGVAGLLLRRKTSKWSSTS